MKTLLKLEELAMFLASIALLFGIGSQWWWYLLLLIGPDISMIGYLAGNKTGAWMYNIFHHKGVGAILFGLAVLSNFPEHIATQLPDTTWLMNIGIVIFGHSSMDRFFGYGLKYENGFKFTHLGTIGKK